MQTPSQATPWRPDILNGYSAQAIPLDGDCEGPALATLVRYDGAPKGVRRAVLHLHGYNDYFHCAEMGPRFAAEGWGFYAIDLRKHGRSLQTHQSACLVRDFSAYYPELDEAVARIRGAEGMEHLVLSAHSTGGLIASVFAADCGGIDAMFLNAPFLAFRVGRRDELMLRSLVRLIGRFRPAQVIPRTPDPRYHWSIHKGAGRGGEWDFDEAWKRPGDLPLQAGFIRASARAHDRVRAGLRLPIPIFAAASGEAGGWGEDFDASFFATDVVLDPEIILARARRIGPLVETHSVPGGLHDLLLSAKPIRDGLYGRLFAWLETTQS